MRIEVIGNFALVSVKYLGPLSGLYGLGVDRFASIGSVFLGDRRRSVALNGLSGHFSLNPICTGSRVCFTFPFFLGVWGWLVSCAVVGRLSVAR